VNQGQNLASFSFFMSNQERMDNMENQLIDIRLAVSALLETSVIYQRNFEVMQRNFDSVVIEIREMQSEIREMRSDIREMQSEIREIQSEVREIQLDVRGLQTENRRILDVLQNVPPDKYE
jgi:chromosome segregation ATPase